MKIQEATKEALECGGGIYRINKAPYMCNGMSGAVLLPKHLLCTYEIVALRDGVPIRGAKDWNPEIDDLLANDWVVLNKSFMTDKDVMRGNNKGVQDIDVHKLTIQAAVQEAVKCSCGFYRKMIMEESERYIVVIPELNQFPGASVVIENGVPVNSRRWWAPTAIDLIADDWLILNGFKI